MIDFSQIFLSQKLFFETQITHTLDFRTEQLKKLKHLLQSNEEKLYTAINQDFGKSEFDTYVTELSLIYKEIDFFVKHLKRIAAPKSVKTNLINMPGRSRIYKEPLGNTLVIGAWNYPYQLTLLPVVSAIAAGNTCMIKPSSMPFQTMQIMAELINNAFSSDYLYVVEGGVDEITEVLKLPFDKIFFTGSPKVGKIVYEAAAKNMTPVLLELGGKSPAIVSRYADLEIAAKRIVWGKFLNAGQTCIAPDYVLVHESVSDSFVEKIKSQLDHVSYSPGSQHFVNIINERNFDRICALIDPSKLVYGGKTDLQMRYIEPTVLYPSTWDDQAMQEEIFGPVLPVICYQQYDEALKEIRKRPKPLAAYLFTDNKKEKLLFTQTLSFGGGCINDTLMHISNDKMPFGGIGNSGIGHYHGIYGFEAFSHQKSVLDKALWGETSLRYPPYSESKLKWIKQLF